MGMEYSVNIDDYVIDMHTSQGRKMGKNRKDFALEGCLVVNEEKEFLVKEWREYYVKEKKDNPDKNKKKKIKKVVKKIDKEDDSNKKIDKEDDSNKKNEKSREEVRNEKYKKIMKMRGKPDFNDLEKELKKIDSIDYKKIRLCTDTTCGSKVMCFEYDGKIWREER